MYKTVFLFTIPWKRYLHYVFMVILLKLNIYTLLTPSVLTLDVFTSPLVTQLGMDLIPLFVSAFPIGMRHQNIFTLISHVYHVKSLNSISSHILYNCIHHNFLSFSRYFYWSNGISIFLAIITYFPPLPSPPPSPPL